MKYKNYLAYSPILLSSEYDMMIRNYFVSISDGQGDGSVHRDSHDDVDDSYECPAVVIYIINPFTYAAQDCDALNRLAVIGLLRCYREIISMLPENMKNNIYLQVSWKFSQMYYFV